MIHESVLPASQTIPEGKEMGTQHDDNLKHEIKTKDKEKNQVGWGLAWEKKGKRFIIPRKQPALNPPPHPSCKNPECPPFTQNPTLHVGPKLSNHPPKRIFQQQNALLVGLEKFCCPEFKFSLQHALS